MEREWLLKKIGDYAEVQNGFAFKSEDFKDDGGIPVIKIKNVASGQLEMQGANHYCLSIESMKQYLIKKKDILIAMTGSNVHQPSSMVGRIARYKLDSWTKPLRGRQIAKYLL